MTGMLASVVSVAEAEIALKHGVDIIDLKNPHAGALGALDTTTVTKIVRSINRAILTSATSGDVAPDDPQLLEIITQMAATGVDIVKVGLFETRPTAHFMATLKKAAAQKIKLVVVIFAENYRGSESYAPLLMTGISGIMLDTKNKTSKHLRDLIHDKDLGEFVRIMIRQQLLTGLAGSLRYTDVARLLMLNPDYLGFRGALCSDNNRIREIDPGKLKRIRKAIPR